VAAVIQRRRLSNNGRIRVSQGTSCSERILFGAQRPWEH
jgi:hypothetical protein